MKEIVVATKNAHKIIEFKAMLEPLGYTIKSLFDFDEFPDIIEDLDTFRGNALKKARELAHYLNKTVIADDSGLEVNSLNGEPGVYSARYAGEHVGYLDNNNKLLKNMEKIKNRSARFVTCMCIYKIEEEPIFFEDYLEGSIAFDFKGENGFGYDPIFIPLRKKITFGEMRASQKYKIDHRFKAFKKIKKLF